MSRKGRRVKRQEDFRVRSRKSPQNNKSQKFQVEGSVRSLTASLQATELTDEVILQEGKEVTLPLAAILPDGEGTSSMELESDTIVTTTETEELLVPEIEGEEYAMRNRVPLELLPLSEEQQSFKQRVIDQVSGVYMGELNDMEIYDSIGSKHFMDAVVKGIKEWKLPSSHGKERR